ncbi:hypothetical protein [Pseudomonas sp. 2FG]|uniref:hypothetical protein n=1 Tax=Pseudomonas sp. 2FG TaxID=2502191 RepID=UPI003531ADDD
MRRLLPLLGLGLGLLSVASVRAEMVALEDNEMSAVQGAGFGIVLEEILLDASQSTITINDITNASGQNVPISVKEFYLGAAGSNKGANLNPVSIGRLGSPFTLNLAKGEALRSLRDDGQFVQTTPSNVAVLELAFPERLTTGGQACIAGFAAAGSNCSSRAAEKVDLGVRFDFQVAAGRTDVINIDITELAMDGSYLRLWGDSARAQLVSEARLNLFAKTFDIMSCAAGAPNCVSAAEQAARSIYLTNAYANVAFGYGKTQPLLFDVSSNGQFVLELPNPLAGAATAAERTSRATDFYANAPRTHVLVDNLNFGGTRPGAGQVPSGGYNFGRNEISGMSFNYLKVTSRDL